MSVIRNLQGMEILDSRGRPTVLAHCELASGLRAAASVPSGASRGLYEAFELRDGDTQRYRGLGCRQAAANIGGALFDCVKGRELETQEQLDERLTAADGTENLSRLGANAILAVSIAFARVQALERGVPLYRHFADIAGTTIHHLPRLTINLFSGGMHAGKQVAIQDVLIVPIAANSIGLALEQSSEVYQCAAELCLERYGMRLLVADEGGLAPPFDSATAMLDLGVDAIRKAGFTPGREMALALDVASSHFYESGEYFLDGRRLSSAGMIETLSAWVRDYPIVSVEDGLAEEDWPAWPGLLEALSNRAIVLGDDLLCTNSARIARAISCNACNALLLKVNQIGTVTGAFESLRMARRAGWSVTVSVRSGETEDNWAADLVTGWQGDFFKNGSLTRSERLAKYNRLLEIEEQTGLPVAPWPGGPEDGHR